MKAILGWLGSLLLAVCIGTTVSLLVLTAMLWWKGALGDERLMGMIAALQGIRPLPPSAEPSFSERPKLDSSSSSVLPGSAQRELAAHPRRSSSATPPFSARASASSTA